MHQQLKIAEYKILKKDKSMDKNMLFSDISVVSCGTMRPELDALQEEGFLDVKRVFFTAPGLHEWPWELKKQI